MTAMSRAALRRARPCPDSPSTPAVLLAEALPVASDHTLWEIREDITRELHARAYRSLTDALLYHLGEFGLIEQSGAPAVAVVFEVTTVYDDGPWWCASSAQVQYADGAHRLVDFAGTTVDDELVELVNSAEEPPADGDSLTVPLLPV